jgi:hypothetical protein
MPPRPKAGAAPAPAPAPAAAAGASKSAPGVTAGAGMSATAAAAAAAIAGAKRRLLPDGSDVPVVSITLPAPVSGSGVMGLHAAHRSAAHGGGGSGASSSAASMQAAAAAAAASRAAKRPHTGMASAAVLAPTTLLYTEGLGYTTAEGGAVRVVPAAMVNDVAGVGAVHAHAHTLVQHQTPTTLGGMLLPTHAALPVPPVLTSLGVVSLVLGGDGVLYGCDHTGAPVGSVAYDVPGSAGGAGGGGVAYDVPPVGGAGGAGAGAGAGEGGGVAAWPRPYVPHASFVAAPQPAPPAAAPAPPALAPAPALTTSPAPAGRAGVARRK